MPTIDISIEDISRLMGLDDKLSVEELDEKVSFAIAEVDSEPEGPDENGHTKVAIDVKTSNRPDLWSAEGIARLVRGQLNQPGLPDISAEPSGFEINVDKSVEESRPYIAAAIVRGLDLDDFLIKQIIQIQDKVDFSFGRRRKRSSIGIYNISMIESPISYTTVDRKYKFIPLQFEEEMTVDEIFDQHPTGLKYAHILNEYENVPMLIDSKDRTLSMPPIINSNDVGRVTVDSTDVLVETTGTNRDAVLVALDCVVQALRDRGGKVESVKINYPNKYPVKSEITPQQELVEMEINPETINTYLGTDFSNEEIIELLRTRRNEAEDKGDTILVKAPPWRKDILHWVDISEDIAMAADYNQLEPTTVDVVTAGKVDPSSEDENMIREIFVGMQLIEVMNYTLTDPDILSTKIDRTVDQMMVNSVKISNPITATFSIIRSSLLPVLISFESKNTHIDYPHRLFEVGELVEKEGDRVITKTHASVLLAGANETYETILSVLDALLRLLDLDYQLEKIEEGLFIPGRRAKIIVEGNEIGHLGEIHPRIITNFGIEVPMAGLEIDLTKVPTLRFKVFETDLNH